MAARVERERLSKELFKLQGAQQTPVKRMTYAIAPRQPRWLRLPRPARLLVCGDIRQPADVVSPGGIASVIGVRSDFDLAPDAAESQRRVALARWFPVSRRAGVQRRRTTTGWRRRLDASIAAGA